MMGMMKKKKGLFSPRSLAIHAISIGASIWLGKAWGKKSKEYRDF